MKEQLINDFIQLGNLLKIEALNNKEVLLKAEQENAWFTEKNITNAITAISNWLTEQNLQKWLSKYDIPTQKTNKTIGLILSGNIPLVGFHDILCVLASGNKALVKLSHKDEVLYKLMYELLVQINPEYATQIEFTEGVLKNIDGIIILESIIKFLQTR